MPAADEVYADYFFDPVIDQDTVIKAFSDSVNDGELAGFDLMIGTNANESRMYLHEDASVNSWFAARGAEFEAKTAQLLVDTLDLQNHMDERARLDTLATAYDYTCPSISLARANARGGGRSWFYNFTKVRDGELAAKMGAYHGAELPYVFNTHDAWLPTSRQDLALSQRIMRYWVNFAATGDPNKNQNSVVSRPLRWKEFATANEPVQFLGQQIKSASHPATQLCKIMAKHK